MAGRPCFGPCDPSIVEWIGYGGLLVAAGVLVVIIYMIGRRAAAGRRTWITVVNGLGLAAAVASAVLVVPRYPRPVFHPAGINAGLDGSGRIDSLYLAGRYAVSWTLQPAEGSPCHLEARLHLSSDGRFFAQLVPLTAAQSGDAADTDGLPGAGYFIEATSDCEWRISVTPRLEPE